MCVCGVFGVRFYVIFLLDKYNGMYYAMGVIVVNLVLTIIIYNIVR